MANFISLILIITLFYSVQAYMEFELPRYGFDTDLYESVLDEELCEVQLSHMLSNNPLLTAQFLDAGIRTPRGILEGNFVDLGNYHQCIRIRENFEPSDIEGKYCMINVPMNQDELILPTLPDLPDLIPAVAQKEMLRNIQSIQADTAIHRRLIEPGVDGIRLPEGSVLANEAFRLAVCLPKTCTTSQFINTVFVNTTTVGFKFTEEFCRLKNDKPFSPGDYAAMGIFGFIIFITVVCTSYDIYYTHILKGDPKKASVVGKIFSVYTNTRRLLTFNSAPGALESLDGIRSLAMMWVVVGHTYSTHRNTHFYNRLETFTWMSSFASTWIVAAPITVDTFFMLSGLLVVYTSVGKISPKGLIQNLHLFYLHRILRIFPLLATGVFLQATLFNHVADGPEWHTVVAKVERCRTYWWSTLTHLQNYLTNSWCVGPSWYLAVDVQMHILSPLILFWVLGKRRQAWTALTLAMLAVMVVTTTYNYLNEFQASSFVQTRTAEDAMHYTRYYYVNTLTRCSPFFVGLLYGYLLNVCKGKKVEMVKWFVALAWICSFAVMAGIIYSSYPIRQMDWNSAFWDGVINSFSRPGWAACLGWMIFACTHGYGGPVNWFLSLRIWKLPARISFAMFIFHFPMMIIINSTYVSPLHFSVTRMLFRALADYMLAFAIAFIATMMIDSPCSIIIKLVIGGGKSEKTNKKKEKDGEEKSCRPDP